MARSPELLLTEASARIEHGELVGAACYAREAVRRSLRDLCRQHGCLLTGETTQQLARALVNAGVFSVSRANRITRLDRILGKASRLYHIRPNRLRRAVEAVKAIG